MNNIDQGLQSPSTHNHITLEIPFYATDSRWVDCVWVILNSAGVERQYSDRAGKTANCQVAVRWHQVGAKESTILGWRLYLPRSWTLDAERRAEAGIPEAVEFRTKWLWNRSTRR